MIFGVHNYYNNNTCAVDSFSLANRDDMIVESSVRVTDQGITIFYLDRLHGVNEKLAISQNLQRQLHRTFGKGLSFATCGDSDCVVYHELNPFYSGMKEIDPKIVTIYSAMQYPEGDWMGVPDNLKVDHIVDLYRRGARQIVGILKPTDADKVAPPEGWAKFERRLEKLYSKCSNRPLRMG